MPADLAGTGITRVGVADLAVSADVNAEIVTYALGSCLGVAIYDAHARVGGLLHAMLPDSAIGGGAGEDAARFVDTGVPALFRACYALGAVKGRMVVKVAGGASIRQGAGQPDGFRIGERNYVMLRRLLWKNGVLISAQDVGGTWGRTMSLRIADGRVTIRAQGTERVL